VLHVLELREQHGVRLTTTFTGLSR
jgi:hypothetical protein